MNEQKRKLSPVAIGGIAVGAALLMLIGGWFFLISPKRGEAASLAKEIETTQQQIAANRAAAAAATNVEPIRYADLFRLAKAMPDDGHISGVVLELNRVATDSGIRFDEIAPQATVSISGYRVMPIELTFEGNFYHLSDFLYRLRNLVTVDDGHLNSTGRLFTVDKLTFAESEAKFPQITATLTVSAFLYGTGPAATSPVGVATAPASTAATTSTDTTAQSTDTSATTSTTTTTTTTASPDTPPAAAGPPPVAP